MAEWHAWKGIQRTGENASATLGTAVCYKSPTWSDFWVVRECSVGKALQETSLTLDIWIKSFDLIPVQKETLIKESKTSSSCPERNALVNFGYPQHTVYPLGTHRTLYPRKQRVLLSMKSQT